MRGQTTLQPEAQSPASVAVAAANAAGTAWPAARGQDRWLPRCGRACGSLGSDSEAARCAPGRAAAPGVQTPAARSRSAETTRRCEAFCPRDFVRRAVKRPRSILVENIPHLAQQGAADWLVLDAQRALPPLHQIALALGRSEERRVGKECRS